MSTRTVLTKAAAITVLAGSLVGISAGVANAMPIEGPQCREMAQAYQSGMVLAENSFASGDYSNGYHDYMMATRAKRNYDRYCLGIG